MHLCSNKCCKRTAWPCFCQTDRGLCNNRQATIGREMLLLNKKLNKTNPKMLKSDLEILNKLEKEIQAIKKKYNITSS